jgi:RHS repeat-associated protein
MRDCPGKELAVYDLITGRLKMLNLFGNGLIGRTDVIWTADTCYDEFGNPFTCYNRQDERFYYIKDHLGSIRMTLDENEEIVAAQDYYPFGEVLRGLEPPVGSNEKYKFTEKERDKETTCDYFGARYYDSELGRWLSVDPLADKYPGWSPYNYCLNNPLKFVDLDGKIPYDQIVPDYTKISPMGMRIHPIDKVEKFHWGVDIAAKQGSAINSFASGTVAKVGVSSSFGNYIIIKHGEKFYSLYAHIRDGEGNISVKEGDVITDGQKIAEVGETGKSTGPHLHIEVGRANSLEEFQDKDKRSDTRMDATEIGNLQTRIERNHPLIQTNTEIFEQKKKDCGLYSY